MATKDRVEVEIADPFVHSKGHVVYKVFFDMTDTVEGTFRTKRVRWELEKRYSDFAELDKELRRQYGAAVSTIKLPPGKYFGSKDPSFIRERQLDLQEYMREVLDVRGILDFESHLGSKALRAFMEWDSRNEKNLLAVGAASSSSSSGAPAAAGGPAPAGASPISPSAGGAGGGGGGATGGAGARPVSYGLAARRVASRSAATAGGTFGVGADAASVTFALVTPTGLVQARPTPGAAAAPGSSPAPLTTMSPSPSAGPGSAAAAASASASAARAAPAPLSAGPSAAAPRPQGPPPATAVAAAPPPAAGPAAAPARPAAPAAAAGRPARPAGGPPPVAPAGGAGAPPRPPAAAAAPVPAADPSRNALLDSIRGAGGGGIKLKKAVTVDKSKPKLGGR